MNLAKLVRRAYRKTTSRNLRNTMPVTLLYDTSAPPANPNVQTDYDQTAPTQVSTVVKCPVHWPNESEIIAKGWQEVEVSDCIIDFDGELDFDGMQNLRFGIDGKTYQPKATGKQVPDYFDVIIGGQRIIRSVVASLVQ